MSSLQNFDYNGQLIQRRADGYINLTQMCKANGKRLDAWTRLKQTQNYLVALECSHGSEGSLIEAEKGNHSDGRKQGTWGHPSLAINLARWISPEFAVWCDAHIFVLMESGQTSLEIDPIAEMKLKIEFARLEKDKAELEYRTLSLRNTVVQTCPEPIQQKILGYQVVEKIEYRDRLVKDGAIINDGTTLNKTELCNRYGILTRSGNPDYRRLNSILDRLGVTQNNNAWELSAEIKENYRLKREFLAQLDELLLNSDRQLWLGESSV